MTKEPDERLDAALYGETPDPDIAPLVEIARDLEGAFGTHIPRAHRDRALFVEGVRARRRGVPWGGVAASAVAASCLVLIALLGRSALPGEALYPVRRALNNVGLAQSASDEADKHIDRARRLLLRAERQESPAALLSAIYELETARRLLEDQSGADARAKLITIERREAQALDLIDELDETDDDDSSGPGSGDDDDSSGPGSGDEDDTDDSSGPGSGDEDDSSGPGSVDEDDSSGPGSGDDADDSDSSGPSGGDLDDEDGSDGTD
jgi:hypothetical protein